MIYLALLRNQWRSFVRSFQGKRLWLIGLGVFPVVLYAVLVLVVLGLFFDKIVWTPQGASGATVLLNTHLASLFLGMLVLRFFFQRPPRMEIPPYLHLPIEHSHLVQYFQILRNGMRISLAILAMLVAGSASTNSAPSALVFRYHRRSPESHVGRTVAPKTSGAVLVLKNPSARA